MAFWRTERAFPGVFRCGQGSVAVGTLHRFYGRSWSLQQRSLDAPQGAAQWAREGKAWSLVERRQRRRRKGTSRLSELQRAPGEWTAAPTQRQRRGVSRGRLVDRQPSRHRPSLIAERFGGPERAPWLLVMRRTRLAWPDKTPISEGPKPAAGPALFFATGRGKRISAPAMMRWTPRGRSSRRGVLAAVRGVLRGRSTDPCGRVVPRCRRTCGRDRGAFRLRQVQGC